MAIFLPPVKIAPMQAKTPHLFCAVLSMQKLFLDIIGGNVEQCSSGPQRGIACKEAFSNATLEGTHLEDASGPAEAAHAHSAGSSTVRSGPVDAQPPMQCSANGSGRQRISAELQEHFK